MQPLESLIVDATFRSRVQAAQQRLDPGRANGVRIVARPTWQPFVRRLMIEEYVEASDDAPVLVVGPPAWLLRHAATADRAFGFVVPVAQIAKPWQRARQWRDNVTLELWRAGWSPQALDRLLVAGDDARCEFVIGTARRTPSTAAVDR